MAVCPHCHQHIGMERLGVPMSPLKARLFDRIKAAGVVGISARELTDDLYRDTKTRNCVSQHIKQLNDLLEETDWVIACDGRSWLARRCLRRRRVRKEAA
jgi:2-polyprenyl-6-methoxyphenol hydroxylase-like FAD-dependent oxidoreductase